MSASRKLQDPFVAPASFRAGPLGRVHRFFARDVWQPRARPLPPLERMLHRAARIAFLTLRGFFADHCLRRARSLTLITAFSIIPMLALAFSVLKGFGLYRDLLEETIHPFLDDFLGPLVPLEGDPNPLRVALDEILVRVEHTDFGGLGTIGLLIVVWAVLRLMGSIEGAFNDIWGVQKARSWVRRVTDYLAIVVAVPIFLVSIIGLTTMRGSEEVMAFLRDELNLGALIDVGVSALPKLGGWLMFTFIYMVLPNTRSRVSSALLGGFVANALWQLTLIGLIAFQVGVASYNVFYAGFAAIPALLFWIQLSWVIVLLGAELAFSHEFEPAYRGLASHRALSHRERVLLALRAALRIAAAFLEEGPRPTVVGLAAELGVAPREVEGVLRPLEEAGLVVAAEDGEASVAYVLARPPESIRIKQVSDALEASGGTDVELPADSGADETLDRLFQRLDQDTAESAHNIDLGELALRTRGERQAVPEGLELPGVQPS